jgi:voltage-gated potassium channel
LTPFATRLLGRRLVRAFETGRILPYMFLTMTFLSVASAVVMRVVDRKDFPTLGSALWWAVVTVTTVGYGDVVPREPLGKAVASVLMIGGYVFLSLVTGIVASALVSRHMETTGREELREALAEIERRLAGLERDGQDAAAGSGSRRTSTSSSPSA